MPTRAPTLLFSLLLSAATLGCSDPAAERAEALSAIEVKVGGGDLQGALSDARALRDAQPTSRDGWIAEALLLEDLWDVEGAAVAFLEGYRAEPEGFPRLPEMTTTLAFYPKLNPVEACERALQLVEDHAARWACRRLWAGTPSRFSSEVHPTTLASAVVFASAGLWRSGAPSAGRPRASAITRPRR